MTTLDLTGNHRLIEILTLLVNDRTVEAAVAIENLTPDEATAALVVACGWLAGHTQLAARQRGFTPDELLQDLALRAEARAVAP